MAIDDRTLITETSADGEEMTYEIITGAAEEGSLAAEVVQAFADEGVTAEALIQADLDGDGNIDAVGLDTDNDGKVDAVAGDMDGDGVIDSVGLDTDGDGQIDAIVSDTDNDGQADLIGIDTDGDGKIDELHVDTDGDGEFDTVAIDIDGDGQIDEIVNAEDDSSEFELEASQQFQTENDGSMNSVDLGSGSDDAFITNSSVTDGYAEDTPTEDVYQPNYDATTSSETYDNDSSQQEMNADAARDAQAQADEFVEQGDYAAAAEARAAAEQYADQAGDSSMLGSSDAADLGYAAERLETADGYRQQQEEHIAEGNYEAAREDAQNAGYAIGDADHYAGGADHTGQADQDAHNLGNAIYDEKNAEYFANNAEWYAEQGSFEAAESSAATAADYQASADNYVDQADPGSVMYDNDPSSNMDSGGAYDAGGYDMTAVDTGFDSSIDTTTPMTDTSFDDTTV